MADAARFVRAGTAHPCQTERAAIEIDVSEEVGEAEGGVDGIVGELPQQRLNSELRKAATHDTKTTWHVSSYVSQGDRAIRAKHRMAMRFGRAQGVRKQRSL